MGMKYSVTVGEKVYLIEINDEHKITVDGVEYTVDFESISGQPVYSLLLNGHSYEAYVYEADAEWQVLLHGDLYPIKVEDERALRLRVAGSSSAVTVSGEFTLRAPMPGLIVEVPVQENQPVQKGDVLVVLESMKMQNELKSPRSGVVSRVRVKGGESVEQNQPLLTVS